MAKADTTVFGIDFTKFIPDMGFPGFEAGALIDAQKKNMEAFSKAGRLAADGFEELLRRQGEMIKASVEEFDAAVKEFAGNGVPEFNPEKQAERAKAGVEQVAANTRELVELASKSGKKVFDIISKRTAESVSEIKTAAPAAAKS
jgi:phasin family protein